MEQTVEQAKKTRRGCLFYGCLTGLVLLLLIIIAGLIGLRYAKKMFNEFTDTSPTPLPQIRMSQAEIDQLRRRVDDFREAVRAHRPAPPLALSADEINALIATDSDLQPLKGKVYVTIEGDRLKGQISLPMEEAGLPMFRGRYLNGNGTFNVSVRNGLLRLTAETIVVKRKPLLDVYMKEIRKQNLARNLNSDPRVSVALDYIQEIHIMDGKLTIVPKENQ